MAPDKLSIVKTKRTWLRHRNHFSRRFPLFSIYVHTSSSFVSRRYAMYAWCYYSASSASSAFNPFPFSAVALIFRMSGGNSSTIRICRSACAAESRGLVRHLAPDLCSLNLESSTVTGQPRVVASSAHVLVYLGQSWSASLCISFLLFSQMNVA
jgi:hypothetical protein